MKARDLDREFDEAKDATGYLDVSKARRPGQERRRVSVDFPAWTIESLHREAERLERKAS